MMPFLNSMLFVMAGLVPAMHGFVVEEERRGCPRQARA
jgi:hypothetical protein